PRSRAHRRTRHGHRGGVRPDPGERSPRLRAGHALPAHRPAPARQAGVRDRHARDRSTDRRTGGHGDPVGRVILRSVDVAEARSVQLSAVGDQLSALLELQRELALESDIDKVLSRITSAAMATLGAERATLYVVDDARHELWSRVV